MTAAGLNATGQICLLFVLCLYVCAGLNQKSMNAFEHAKSYKAPASLSACTKKQQKKWRTPRSGQWLPLECSCDEPAVKNGDCDLRTCINSLLQKTVVILQRPAACHLRARLRGGVKALPPGPKNCVTGGPTLTTYEPSAIPSSIVFNKSMCASRERRAPP